MASEIVVGIDFGTTFSGVSWAVNAGKKEVQLVDDWPNDPNPNAQVQKVPTAISYHAVSTTWGYNVAENSQPFRWFKILLDSDNQYRNTVEPETARQMLGSLNKSAEEVAADYLRHLWEHTKKDIARLKGSEWEISYKVRVVLTVPAIWSEKAKDRTKRAASAAGLPGRVSLVSEPEAAAHAVIDDKKSENDMFEIGDCFVVCDAGGGTVDLISYQVTNLHPFQVEECAVGDGGLCGAVFIDMALEKHLRTVIGEDAYSSLPPKRRKKMMEEFEGVKKAFGGDLKKSFSVDLKGVEDNPENGIEDDTIMLKPMLMRTLFDHVVNQIIHLVEKQITQSQENGGRVKAIMLVGGFGSSKYIFNRLQNANHTTGIQVLQVQRAWSAICRGATIWGLERSEADSDSPPPYQNRTVGARIARFSYGVVVAVPYQSLKHRQSESKLFPDGKWYACNQMHWLIKKGERLTVDTERSFDIEQGVEGIKFLTTGLRDFSKHLWYSAEDTPAVRKDENVKPFCSVEFKIDCDKLWMEKSYKDKATGKKWRNALFTLILWLDSSSLTFGVVYQGEPVAQIEANYLEDGAVED